MYQINIDKELESDDLRLLVSLVKRLPYESRSLLAAKFRGKSEEHFGWGPAEYQLASLIDVVNFNTSVTQVAGTKHKPKVPQPSYRPGGEEKKVRQIKPKSIKDMKNIQLGRL